MGIERLRAATASLRSARAPEDYPALLDVWARSVAGTHDFLKPEHFDVLRAQLVTSFSPHVTLTVAVVDGKLVGFSGIAGDGLEMLFVDPDWMGCGVGTLLLDDAVGRQGARRVDVNEQNESAWRLYESKGFHVVAHSDRDGQGWDYPIVHLER